MKKLLKYFLTYLLYLVFLFICYKIYLTKVYGYYGFFDNMNIKSFFVSILTLLLIFVYIYKQKTNSYSKFIVYILVLINFIPSVVTFCFMPFNYKFFILLVLYWIFLILFVNFVNKIYVMNNDKRFKSNISNVYLLVLVEFIIVSFIIIKYTGINLNFDDVYTLRENYFLSRMPIFLSYLYAAFKVVNPLLFIYLYSRNKKIWALFSMIVQILAFLCDGSKSTLFSIMIAFIIVKYLKGKKDVNFLENENSKFYILFGIFAINFIGFLEYSIFKSSFVYNYFIRRLFFIPSLLNHCYYDFFSIHSIDFFRQSILGKIGFTSPYTSKIQNIIGLNYFHDANILANNGLFSDAYMNLGSIGVIVMPFIISVTLRFLDYCVKHINSLYLVTILISVSYIFLSSSFFTVLLTHGYLILCIILLVVIPKDNNVGEHK